eukprot:CAMPEP_0178443782 /NCGR_PEP_ID=MMETSP0689_2-20121128/39101_1 /TAXON_ID=160604 /ORGANISM="Amphidinium massartii, Strain CS-259" /LENGTH=578 /DNA_ID=CAMNT_0020067857 /DNA_START=46 /DNA_END=1782 /DNA_ORIENTATION=+
MAAKSNSDKNFWLWGTWGRRVIRVPFLTQKIEGKLRNVVIGATFIIVLKEDGSLHSWGEDKAGCLGLGTDAQGSPEPKQIKFPSEFQNGKDKVVDIQYGKHHILALTNQGKVYAWGENTQGQLGVNDLQTRYEPVAVEGLDTVVQILAVDNMSYALTSKGDVFAWGDNKEGCLALEHDNMRVMKPEPMMKIKDEEAQVKRLELKECGVGGKGGKTIIAFVGYADKLKPEEEIGGFAKALGDTILSEGQDKQNLNEGTEKDIFEGVDLMRRVMDNTHDWWNHMADVRHGAPYDDNPTQTDDSIQKKEDCSALQLDTFVSLDNLERASYELDMLIQSAKSQLSEIKSKRGTKNVKFMLSMFMDDCKLRREKIRRTVIARQLMDHKRNIQHSSGMGTDVNSRDHAHRLTKANTQLTNILNKVRNLPNYDVFTKSLQDSLVECIECKIQLHQTQIDALRNLGPRPPDPIVPALRIIKERWGKLKQFSVYNLYQECHLRGQNMNFNSEEEMLAFLVQSSDAKIDQIIQIDKDKMISRDSLVPPLCYDLLIENAELRKMCNTYQLKVLRMREERHGGPSAHAAQ